jgi:hypothetical protein
MQKVIRDFIIKLFLITLTILCIASGIFYFWSPKYYYDLFPLILFIFPSISFIVHYQLLKTSQKSASRFNVAFMLTFMLKLFIYGGVTALVLNFEPDNKKTVVLTVLLIYAVFMVFETRQILIDIKKLNDVKK